MGGVLINGGIAEDKSMAINECWLGLADCLQDKWPPQTTKVAAASFSSRLWLRKADEGNQCCTKIKVGTVECCYDAVILIL